MYDFIVDYFKITDCNLDGAEYECQRRQHYKTHNSTQLTSKLSGMGCLLSWSWYGYAIQLGQLERLRFCLSKFCIPGLGEFLACEESLSPSKEGGSPSNVSESENVSLHYAKMYLNNYTYHTFNYPTTGITIDGWFIILKCLRAQALYT